MSNSQPDTSLLTALQGRLHDPDSLLINTASHDEYFHDATGYSVKPHGILIAESVDDLTSAVTFCHEHHIPITTRGAGTGLSGGCVASPGALVISVEKLTDLAVDPERRIAICGPGVITKTLQDAAAEHGLTYPPDPASYAESTLGGNIAENAGGLRCVKYGVTRDYVLGLEAVTAAGETIGTGYFNDYRGMNVCDVLIGSEGTLAILTRIAVRLTPVQPRGVTILAAFPEMRQAGQTVTDIRSAGLIPTVMEFIDGDAAEASNRYEPTTGLERAGAILLLETSGGNPDEERRQIEQICHRNRANLVRTEPDPDKAESLWTVRRNISKAVKAMAAYAISEDVVVPNSQFPELVDFVADMNRTSPLRINSFGHAGDGNLHVYFLSEDGSAEDLRRIDHEIERLMRTTIAMGGTLTGEHGIGLAKRQYLSWEFDSATLRAMTAVRDVFDPARLLNPDKLFAPSHDKT